MAGKLAKEILQDMKNIKICDIVVTIKTKMNEENKEQMKELVNELMK